MTTYDQWKSDSSQMDITPEQEAAEYENNTVAMLEAHADSSCQYAIDVGMPEYQCVGKCQYALHGRSGCSTVVEGA